MKEFKNKRREFIRNAGLGAVSLIIPAATTKKQAKISNAKVDAYTNSTVELLSNQVQIELCYRDDRFLGIGKVLANGVTLRDNAHPLFCEIRSPDGILVTDYIIQQKEITPDKISIRMKARTEKIPVMDWMLHSVRNRVNLYGWAETPIEHDDTVIVMEIFPVNRMVGKYSFAGFSYRYLFESSRFGIYKILDRGTWEINGKALGNESWMRAGHIQSIVSFTRSQQHYSTENYMKGIANPNIFQFLPLQTELQGFTFQAHDRGVLVTFPTEIAHVRTLIEKPRNKDHIFHFHEHCNDLSGKLATSPVEVLWLSNLETSRTERYNIYEAVRSHIHKDLQQKAGIQEEWIVPYGQIEEWTEPDFDRYTDEILPAFVEKGVKRIFIPNEFQNVMNTWGLSNMCCNVDFKFSETVGLEKIRRFCTAAKKAGMVVDMWGNTAISTTTEMFRWREGDQKGIRFLPVKDSITEVLQSAKDPFVRNPSNAIEADHYTPRFAVLNLRDQDVMDYWMKSWTKAYDVGITGIFLDSSFNMTSDKFHFIQNAEKDSYDPNSENSQDDQRFYRPEHQPDSAILTQYHAYLQLVKKMQQIGYSYCGEDLGVFGVHRHGPDMDMILDSLPIWKESIINFDEKLATKAGLDPMDVFFKGLAFRVMWALKWDFKTQSLDLGIRNPAAFKLFKAFNIVNQYMRVRNIQPDGRVVRYNPENDNKTSVWWVLEPVKMSFPKKQKVLDILNDRKFYAKSWDAPARQIYLLKSM